MKDNRLRFLRNDKCWEDRDSLINDINKNLEFDNDFSALYGEPIVFKYKSEDEKNPNIILAIGSVDAEGRNKGKYFLIDFAHLNESINKVQEEVANDGQNIEKVISDLEDFKVYCGEIFEGLTAEDNAIRDAIEDLKKQSQEAIDELSKTLSFDVAETDTVELVKINKEDGSFTLTADVKIASNKTIDGKYIVDTQLEKSENGIFYRVDLACNKEDNSLLLTINGDKVREISLPDGRFINKGEYDANNEDLVLKYNLDNVEPLRINLSEIIKEYITDNNNHSVKLNIDYNKEGKSVISGDVVIGHNENNILSTNLHGELIATAIASKVGYKEITVEKVLDNMINALGLELDGEFNQYPAEDDIQYAKGKTVTENIKLLDKQLHSLEGASNTYVGKDEYEKYKESVDAEFKSANEKIGKNESAIKDVEAKHSKELTEFKNTVENNIHLEQDAREKAVHELDDKKADKATTLGGYNITDAYTKTEIDNSITEINNTITETVKNSISAIVDGAPKDFDTLREIAEYISKNQSAVDLLNTAITSKADKDKVYTKEETEHIISDSITEEKTRATRKEESLETSLTNIKGSLEANIKLEEKSRTNADNILEQNINKIEDRVEKLEDNSNSAKVSIELLQQQNENLQKGIEVENSRAENAESKIKALIQSEVDRATSAEQVNATAISKETARAMEVERTNYDAIIAESDRAKGVENELRLKVQAHNDAIEANYDAIIAESDRAKGVENELTQKDSRQDGVISKLREDLTTEASTARQAEAKLREDFIAADSQLSKNLIEEITRATSIDIKHTEAIDYEIKNRQEAISSEKTRAEAAEQKLTEDLAAEIVNRDVAIRDVINNLDSEKNGASNHVTVTVTQIDGKLSSVVVTDRDIASANDLNNVSSKVTNLDSTCQDLKKDMGERYTKEDVDKAIAEAKSSIINGADTQWDTLQEIGTWINTNKGDYDGVVRGFDIVKTDINSIQDTLKNDVKPNINDLRAIANNNTNKISDFTEKFNSYYRKSEVDKFIADVNAEVNDNTDNINTLSQEITDFKDEVYKYYYTKSEIDNNLYTRTASDDRYYTKEYSTSTFATKVELINAVSPLATQEALNAVNTALNNKVTSVETPLNNILSKLTILEKTINDLNVENGKLGDRIGVLESDVKYLKGRLDELSPSVVRYSNLSNGFSRDENNNVNVALADNVTDFLKVGKDGIGFADNSTLDSDLI